jgi:hypothetical protein
MSKSEQTTPARVSDGAQMPLFDNKALHHQSHENESGLTSAAGGVVPGGWRVKRLGDLAIVSAGGTPSRGNANYWGGDIPWLTTSEVDGGYLRHGALIGRSPLQFRRTWGRRNPPTADPN